MEGTSGRSKGLVDRQERSVEADVRAASEQAGVPFERVLESLRIDGAHAQGEEEQQ